MKRSEVQQPSQCDDPLHERGQVALRCHGSDLAGGVTKQGPRGVARRSGTKHVRNDHSQPGRFGQSDGFAFLAE
ncbi:hypothetical protein GCM10009603_52900 [Nocardiopsis exhalans]